MKTLDEINKETLPQTKKVLDELTKNYAEFSIEYYKHQEKYKNSQVIVIEQEILEELKQENHEMKELLKLCKEMLQKSITYQCMDSANHYIKKVENDIYEPILDKIERKLNNAG